MPIVGEKNREISYCGRKVVVWGIVLQGLQGSASECGVHGGTWLHGMVVHGGTRVNCASKKQVVDGAEATSSGCAANLLVFCGQPSNELESCCLAQRFRSRL
jgi:hypothetical protein